MTPFSVLHVCVGNICRSPMAERLLLLALGPHAGLVYSHSAGTGGWHRGEPMNPPAARQVLARGADTDGFGARQLTVGHVEGSDLVLTATVEQYDHVLNLSPTAANRTFVLGQFGRLLAGRAGDLPDFTGDAESLYTRGVALVTAVDALRGTSRPVPADDLADPYGLDDRTYARTADEIESTLRPLAGALLGGSA
ncbi:phosphotyrosine protein phosphatase [Longispora sp. NPDC051575]|uniref:arsenate reductase/protein-tyrosine-phosphatase family protein n=1 Tax=Longispora sp. NPDC051575 TaxID=3154943 RepID=UPI00344689F7